MHNLRKAALFICPLLLSLYVSAQDTLQVVEEKDVMRSHGKIFVVMAVVIIILGGLLLYLFRIDRKITRLENASPK